MSRFDARKQRARENRQKFRRANKHHAAWGVVCLVLLGSIFGAWGSNQALRSEVATLQQQLETAKRPTKSTCEVRGDWQPNSTTTLTVDNRSLLVHTPHDFAPDQYLPLVMVYPGKGGAAHVAQVDYGLDTLPAIVVYPQATVGTDGYLSWQGAPYSSSADDITFTSNILNELETRLCIDRTKIYAIGMSNGGGFTALLSCELSDRFAAYAIVAGAMYPASDNCEPKQPTTLFNIHGDADLSVPYRGSPLRKLPDIEKWTTRRAQLNGCQNVVTRQVDFNTHSTDWTECKEGTVVKNIRIQGGGHTWGLTSNDLIWHFLSQFSL